MKRLTLIVALALFALKTETVHAQFVMTFDTAPAGAFARDTTYVENGIISLCESDNAAFAAGAPYFPSTTLSLYFHGTDEYIEFRLDGGGRFDLEHLDLITNGFGDRWIETSSTDVLQSLGSPVIWTPFDFTQSWCQNIEWFRVGTPFEATQLDNVTITPVPEPAAFALLFGLGSLGFEVWRRARNNGKTNLAEVRVPIVISHE